MRVASSICALMAVFASACAPPTMASPRRDAGVKDSGVDVFGPADSGSVPYDGGSNVPDVGNRDAGPGDTGGGGDGGGDGGACIEPSTATPGTGRHNAGLDCDSCHAAQPAARRWTVAGTLYDGNGLTRSGAVIEITDASNQVFRLTTQLNGNFYMTNPVTFPLRLRASSCPSDVQMSSTAASGNCNSCHNAGMRINLP